MKKFPAQRFAQIGLGVLWLVLVRSLGEYFRLKHYYGRAAALTRFEPFIGGCLMAALCLGLAIALYVTAKHKSSIVVCVGAIIGLVIYKIMVIG